MMPQPCHICADNGTTRSPGAITVPMIHAAPYSGAR